MMRETFKIAGASWRSSWARAFLLAGASLLSFGALGHWHEDLPSKQGWSSVPNSSLEQVCPRATLEYDFPGRCRYVIAAWNGGIADTKQNRLIIWGGGHADYAGNEIYSFDLSPLRMQRLNDPSPINKTSNCVETLSDGKPNSRHTYAGLAYIAHANQMFSFGGSLNQCGYFSGATWTLDLDTLKWANMSPKGASPAAVPGVIADYDPNSHMVFLHDTSDFWRYDYDKNRFDKVGRDLKINYHMNGVVDPKRKIFLAIGAAGSEGGGLKAISIAPGSNYAMRDWTSSASSTCGPLLSASYPGLAYDRALDRIVGWPDFGNAVYILDPDTKSCTVQSFAGGPPDSSHAGSAHTSNGTFGRFRYFPDADIFVLVNEANTNAYVLRLSASVKK